jgi:hypothetical protein
LALSRFSTVNTIQIGTTVVKEEFREVWNGTDNGHGSNPGIRPLEFGILGGAE